MVRWWWCLFWTTTLEASTLTITPPPMRVRYKQFMLYRNYHVFDICICCLKAIFKAVKLYLYIRIKWCFKVLNKNVDNKFRAQNTFLKYPSSAIVKRLEIQSVWERVNQHLTKGLKQESQNQLRSAMSEGGWP